jgi:FKBP-type peptidyl-prolyl cis-trans isomerase 2
MRVLERGDKVQVHYVKVFQDGSTVSSRGKAPTELIVGTDHPRLPGLGLELVGLAEWESRTFIVPARDAYGPSNPRQIRRMARWRFAEHEDLCVGQCVRVWDRKCRRRLARIVEIGDETVVVDANHRWAGQSLELEVEVISIRGQEIAGLVATAEERHPLRRMGEGILVQPLRRTAGSPPHRLLRRPVVAGVGGLHQPAYGGRHRLQFTCDGTHSTFALFSE